MSGPLFPKKALLIAEEKENRDTSTYSFEVIGESLEYRPGQFNMIGFPGFHEAPISFSSLAKKNGFSHTVRTVGNVTSAIERMKSGAEIMFRGPYGSGWPIEKTEDKHLLLIAGGIGVAPLRPVIIHALRNGATRSINLLYGARTPADFLFNREFEKWKKKGINIFLTVDEKPPDGSWNGETGVVTSLLDKLAIPFSQTITFTCGPEIMMRFVARSLKLRKQRESDIYVSLERRMRCGLAHCGHCQIGPMFVCKDGPVFNYQKIRKYADTLL